MTVWYHQSTILKQRRALRTAGLVTLCVAFITTLLFSAVSHAATGINKTLSFQGRLQSSSGAIVADGYYNIQFKIYQDGSGTTAGNPDGTLKWTESYINNGGTSGVQVKNGYFSVTLGSKTAFGSSVDWNQDTLWLSMNVAGTASTCTTFGSGSCTADGEMLPMKRLTSTPYALNAGAVGGLTSSDLIHNQSTAQQTSSNFWISGTGRADTALQAPVVDTATAGTLTIGGANATSITMADDVTVAAGKSLTLAGGNTASRPASPTEGMLYYDTSTKQLLVYSDGKWKSDGKSATKIVAASDSSQALKDGADYVADGTSDQSEINSALTAAAGGRVYLTEGTYTIDGSISVPNNTTLAGAGRGTHVQFANIAGQTKDMIVNTDTTTGEGVVIRDLRLDGQRDINTTGTINGIQLYGIGSGSSGTARQGASMLNVWVLNFTTHGITINNSSNGTISGSTVQNNGSNGINISSWHRSTITNNTVVGNNGWGVRLGGSTGSTVSTNSIAGNGTIAGTATGGGLVLDGSSDTNTISGNSFRDNTAATANSTIYVTDAADNTIVGNSLFDSAGSGHAITITANGSRTTLTSNAISGTGPIDINDLSPDTIHANQLDANGKLINKSDAGMRVQTSTNNTNAFDVQNAAGASALTVNTSNNSVLIAGTLDTTTATALAIGSTNASSITIGKSASNIATTLLGTVLVKPTTGNDSTTAFQIQRANGTAMFTADSTNQTITFGNAASGNYTVISTSTGAITKYGTARNTKSITLTPEFAGAVLDSQSDSACTSASNGTMTAGLDSVGRTNYYNWTSTQGTNQCYDVVVQVPVPAGFSGWQSTAISMKASNTSNASYGIAIIDSNGSYDANYGSSYASPGTLSTSWSNVATSSLSGTYTRNDYFTIKIRMTAKNSANIQLGNITLNYYSDN